MRVRSQTGDHLRNSCVMRGKTTNHFLSQRRRERKEIQEKFLFILGALGVLTCDSSHQINSSVDAVAVLCALAPLCETEGIRPHFHKCTRALKKSLVNPISTPACAPACAQRAGKYPHLSVCTAQADADRRSPLQLMGSS